MLECIKLGGSSQHTHIILTCNLSFEAFEILSGAEQVHAIARVVTYTIEDLYVLCKLPHVMGPNLYFRSAVDDVIRTVSTTTECWYFLLVERNLHITRSCWFHCMIECYICTAMSWYCFRWRDADVMRAGLIKQLHTTLRSSHHSSFLEGKSGGSVSGIVEGLDASLGFPSKSPRSTSSVLLSLQKPCTAYGPADSSQR